MVGPVFLTLNKESYSMKYTYILASEPNSGPEPGGEGWEDYSSAYINWNMEAQAAGIFSAGEPVHPPSTATTLRKVEGDIKLHDGPFAETKECIIGWYLVECENLDEAVEWASKIPLVAYGYGAVEVRPVIDMEELT